LRMMVRAYRRAIRSDCSTNFIVVMQRATSSESGSASPFAALRLGFTEGTFAQWLVREAVPGSK